MSRAPSVEELVEGVRAGDRVQLARAITLVESTREVDRVRALEVLSRLAKDDRKPARRIGISGAPGVGKSTFVEALGMHLVQELGHSIAVLAVDPSSPISGGSILGDKARMNALAQHERAYVRPSPSATTLGGVARRTREALDLVEAAGCQVILIETVGVGQSEVAVASMVDFFLLLVQPGAGDELQGIKKGIVELADGFAVTKADGELEAAAGRAAAQLGAALSLLSPQDGKPAPFVRTTAALAGLGIPELWSELSARLLADEKSGALATRREGQLEEWLFERIDEELRAAFRAHPGVSNALSGWVAKVRAGSVPPGVAARELLGEFRANPASGQGE